MLAEINLIVLFIVRYFRRMLVTILQGMAEIQFIGTNRRFYFVYVAGVLTITSIRLVVVFK